MTNLMHGHASQRRKSGEYTSWVCMKMRCNNKNTKGYDRYGGRGITVCDRWQNSFLDFLQDMGPRPGQDYSIERVENNKNYEPGNCRWATRIEQANNRRANTILEFNGRRLTISQWSAITGLHRCAIHYRINHGWTVERALTKRSQREKT